METRESETIGLLYQGFPNYQRQWTLLFRVVGLTRKEEETKGKEENKFD